MARYYGRSNILCPECDYGYLEVSNNLELLICEECGQYFLLGFGDIDFDGFQCNGVEVSLEGEVILTLYNRKNKNEKK